jgi:hypothetical protein
LRAHQSPSANAKLSPIPLPRVQVQGQFGHSVELDQSLVLNRGDIVQKYSSVTKQRGFQDAAALQELHEENRQRKLNLTFPNPLPPSPISLSLLEDASRKAALQKIQYILPPFLFFFDEKLYLMFNAHVTLIPRLLGLYEPFPSSLTLGEFFLDSALPCAEICVDARSSLASFEEGDTNQLEKVRELVSAAAASLSANSAAPCGPVTIMYCMAEMHHRGNLSANHLGNVLVPAMASLLRLSALSFVDFSHQGCSVISSLVERMSAVETGLSLVLVDVNIILKNRTVLDDTTSIKSDDEETKSFGELDALISCCFKAIIRACNLKIIFVLPQPVSCASFLKRFPLLANASADFYIVCNIPINPLNSWDITDDSAAATSVPIMFALLRLLRSIRFNPYHHLRAHSCWWELWAAETAVMNNVNPPVQAAISMLKSRSLDGQASPVSRVVPASRLPTGSSMLSRGSTPAIAAKTKSTITHVSALESIFPSIICTFSDDLNEEEVMAWFKVGGAGIITQQELQLDNESKPQGVESSLPVLVTAARFKNIETVSAAIDLGYELIESFGMKLRDQGPSECVIEGTTELDDLQTNLSRLIMCSECKKRGLVLILPSRSSAMFDCFHRSLRPIPSHVIIVLVTPVRMVHQVQSWLHPTIETHIDDAGAAQVRLDFASDAASRMPACVNGHESIFPPVNSQEEPSPNATYISWTQIYDTRCAIMLHKAFANFTFSKCNATAKQPQFPSRSLSPYSPQGSPRFESPLNGRSSPNQDRRSPSSSNMSRKIHVSTLIRQPLCCQALSVACEIFSSQSVLAIIGTVLALPGIPLHLLPHAALAILKQTARDVETFASNDLSLHRDLTATAVCLAPFFFHTSTSITDLSFTSKFPKLLENFKVQFGISRSKWIELQQTATFSLMLVADPASDGTFVGLSEAGSWLCENLLLLLLNSNCHDTACEVASNVLKWHAVQQRMGSAAMRVLVKRCCGIIEYLALQEGPETFKVRILRSTLNDLQIVLEVLHMNVCEKQQVGILEGLVLRLWICSKPSALMVNLASSALNRIAVLQDRVLQIFRNSAGILKFSAPGCMWRLLRRANAAEWLSHVRYSLITILSHYLRYFNPVCNLFWLEATAGCGCKW